MEISRNKNKIKNKKLNNKKIIAKCGFITGDPDIDAVSRLFWPINVKNVKSAKEFYFAPGTFTPFNDQNTSMKKIILCYILSRYQQEEILIFGQVILYAKWQKYMER